MLHEIIESMLHFFEGLGYWGIMLGLMVEVIPSEIVLAYGGYLVSEAGGGELSFGGAVIFWHNRWNDGSVILILDGSLWWQASAREVW
jgi:membrane protein DedA with SNARE-associated domain